MQYKYAKFSGAAEPREDVILKIEDDGTVRWVPNMADNRDWKDYQAWLAADEANEPLAAD